MLDEARGFLDDVVALRRSIHREPELGLELPRTQAKVLHALNGLPLDIRTGQRTTSVVADLRGCAPGRTIILRADMDALPLQEDTDVPFKSTIAGRMHACGHDAHTAMLVGAVRLLLRHQADFAGTVRFMFQPGEEGYAGARVMLEEGLLAAPADGSEAPSAAFALHATPRWQTGTVLTRPGPVLASTDNFTIVVSGRGGHASAPHMAADPVPVACEIVMALQTFVTRSVNIFTPGHVVESLRAFSPGLLAHGFPRVCFCSRKSADFLPRATRPGPRVSAAKTRWTSIRLLEPAAASLCLIAHLLVQGRSSSASA